jgi:uncharacterized BrkB/YihY/UPF0761 family membrane protein
MPRVDRPRFAARLVVSLVLAVVALFGAVQLVDSLRTASKRATDYREQSSFRREFAGAWLIGLDREFMTAAAAYVGSDDTFAVATGPRVQARSPWTKRFLATFARSALLPAEAASTSRADWLLCYGCELTRTHGFETVWEQGPYVVARRAQ